MKKPMQSFCKAIGLILFFLAGYTTNATNYYFSASSGDDSRTATQAQNPSTPWQSLAKLNAVFSSLSPGDTVFLKRGDLFYGPINATASGQSSQPIVIAAYGGGKQPVVSGLQTIQNWKSKGGNVWESQESFVDAVNVVLINGQAKPIGRYPNNGYLTIDSHNGNTSVTDAGLASGPNWSDGEIVIRKNRWVIDRNKINTHAGNTISYASESGYHATDKYGYFIQNHPAALDQEGEWYFQKGKLGTLVKGNAASLSVEASVIPTLVQLSNQSNLQFLSIDFTGANHTAFRIQNAQNIVLTGCSIRYSGVNAVDASDVQGLKITSSEIVFSNNVALNLISCHGTVLQNNTIANTGTIAGMGKGGDGTYSAILINGDNNLVEGNKIENTGYVPLSFNGSSVLIKNNFINRFTLVKDDGGGIYTWNNGSNAPSYTNRRVEGNIVINGSAASAGTDDAGKKFSHGIYIDDNAANVDLLNNTVANNEGFGIYVHNARNLAIKKNTAYNNSVQLSMVHDDIAANSPIRNTEVKGNVFFSLQPGQPVAEYKSRRDDLNDFGSFDDNSYSRPTDDNAYIGTLKNVAGNYVYQPVDVEGWQAMSGKDKNSKSTPKTFAVYHVTSLVSGNLFGNGSFNNNISGLYAFSPANNCKTAWTNNGLDGGSLVVSFSSMTNNSKGTVVIGVGAISAGKKYRLRFSLKGGNENKLLDVYLRKSGAPYNDVTARHLISVKPDRKEVEVLFEPTETTQDGSIGIDVQEQNNAVFLDNIELCEVTTGAINLADSIRFVYNVTPSVLSASLPGSFIDVHNTSYSGNVSSQPYSSVVLMAASGIVVPPPTGSCAATGTILREQWNNISGSNVADVPLAAKPASSGQLTSFEGTKDLADKYGSRIRGYVCAPITGYYHFFISGDDATELWLSPNDDPAQKQKIAYNLSWTGLREWEKFPSQKSAAVHLEAGKKYYIEALHKEGDGSDHLSVGWQLPGGGMEAPIPGNRLSPFQVAPLTDQTISFSPLQNVVFGSGAVILNATASSGLPVNFTLVSGLATINGNTVTPTAVGVVVIKASQSGNQQYNAAPDVTQTLMVLPVQPSNQCNAAGSILWEQWTGVNGNDVAQVPQTSQPTASRQLSVFEGPVDLDDKYGSRIRGYICPPESGNYTFYISGDDAAELWLSSDDAAANKQKIAYHLSWTGYREWTKYASQKSASVYLQAGKKYYIEALHKEGNGGDHLSIAWTLPGGVMEAPIAGSRLSPFVPATGSQCAATGTILREEWKDIQGNDVSQIPQNSMPHRISEVSLFEAASNGGNNFGQRIRGFICPPQTGYYTFYIAGDDATELWLSNNALPSGRKKIAYNLSWTDPREWNKFPSQRSAPVFLEAGKRYYIEALHKEGAGDDHLSVAWELPDGTLEAPISGSRLSPIIVDILTDLGVTKAPAVQNHDRSLQLEMKESGGLKAFPNPFTQQTKVQFRALQTGLVKVEVCDVSGKVVKELFRGMLKEQETKLLVLDGYLLRPGIYMVRMTTGDSVNYFKIVKLDR